MRQTCSSSRKRLALEVEEHHGNLLEQGDAQVQTVDVEQPANHCARFGKRT